MKNEEEKRKNLKILIESVVAETLAKDSKQTVLKEQDLMYKIFVEPFKDIIDTATHGLKKITAVTGRNLLKTAAQSVALLIPWISNEEIKTLEAEANADIKSYVDSVDEEYRDVLDRNIDALMTSHL